MSCDCPAWAKVVHLEAELARLEHDLERLTRDVARESVDRQDAVRSVRAEVRAYGHAADAVIRAATRGTW